jgi:hypothetical protein
LLLLLFVVVPLEAFDVDNGGTDERVLSSVIIKYYLQKDNGIVLIKK